MRVRTPAVAGRFYPGERRRLAEDVAQHLRAPAPVEPEPASGLRALVVPHAGYVYSGPTAGVGYRLLPPLADQIRRIVLLGPPHYVPVAGLALSSADAWRTPLGEVPVDLDGRAALLEAASVRGHRPGEGPAGPEHGPVRVAVDDGAHDPEHCLEVQVPFLQVTVPGVPILPVLVGARDSEAVADLLVRFWSDPGTLLLVSTDLSHYEPVDVARRLDERTARAVCEADADAVGDSDACGARALRPVLKLAARTGAVVRLLDLRTSADTAGDPYRVVGYGAFAVEDDRAAA